MLNAFKWVACDQGRARLNTNEGAVVTANDGGGGGGSGECPRGGGVLNAKVGMVLSDNAWGVLNTKQWGSQVFEVF